jgi:hypothetical protein
MRKATSFSVTSIKYSAVNCQEIGTAFQKHFSHLVSNPFQNGGFRVFKWLRLVFGESLVILGKPATLFLRKKMRGGRECQQLRSYRCPMAWISPQSANLQMGCWFESLPTVLIALVRCAERHQRRSIVIIGENHWICLVLAVPSGFY